MPKGEADTRLYLVCSPLGGVGKTITARLLLDHALSKTLKARGFDTNPHDPDLEHLFPIETTAIDLSSTRGQMRLFDRLVEADGAPKIVDLWHATYDLFWAQADNLGFFREARAQGIEPVVVLQADRKDRFLHEMRTLPARSPNLTIVLVHNMGLMKTPSSDMARLAIIGAKRLLIVPEFDDVTVRLLEQTGTFANKVRRGTMGEDGRGTTEGRELLTRVFGQLDFLELSLKA